MSAVADELREMNDEQLAAQLVQVQKDLFNLKFQAAVEKIDAPSNLKKFRKEVARIKTIQRERSLANEAGVGATSGDSEANNG